VKRAHLTIVCVLTLAGCGTAVDYGPVAVYEPHGVIGDPIPIEGMIHISDTCVTLFYLEEDVALVFPSDEVSWDAATGTLTYLGVPYQDGDFISLSVGGDPGRAEPLGQECPVGRFSNIAPAS
jgi:hypothetical protein